MIEEDLTNKSADWIIERCKQSEEVLNRNPYWKEFQELKKKDNIGKRLDFNMQLLMEANQKMHIWWMLDWIERQAEKSSNITEIIARARKQLEED